MSLKQTFYGAAQVVRLSTKTVLLNPQILAYPFLALLFISLTYPVLGSSIFHQWYDAAFNQADQLAPHKVGNALGLVGFSAFYAAFVTALFTCAVSAGVLAKLENKPIRPLEGVWQVIRHFFRVSRFAFLSVFLFPVGVYAQRRKLPHGILGVVGSSLTLHMANLAPAILSSKEPFGATVRDSINTLGTKWKESLLLKVGIYVIVFIFVAGPKLTQHHFFTSPSASNVGWLVSLEVGASSYVTLKVINAIFTTVLYHQAKKSG